MENTYYLLELRFDTGETVQALVEKEVYEEDDDDPAMYFINHNPGTVEKLGLITIESDFLLQDIFIG